MKVVTGPEMRAIEQEVELRGTPIAELAERAGRALADTAVELGPAGEFLILAGPGNNGGDGVIAARILDESGLTVTLYAFKRSADSSGFATVATEDDGDLGQLRLLLSRSPVVLDCLLGTGATRPPEGRLAEIITVVNESGAPVLAADIPTGVNPDTGAVPAAAIHVTRTLAFGFAKVGDVVYPGAGYAGHLQVASLGIPDELAASIRLQVTSSAEAAACLPRRSLDSNKGTYGRVVVVGGSVDFPGAPGLSAIAALRAGAGLAHAAVLRESAQVIASHALEPVYSVLPEEQGHIAGSALPDIANALERADAAVVGPGLGSSEGIVSLVRGIHGLLVERRTIPAVIDADGLNALARIPHWWSGSLPLVVTPHPGEMARLTGRTIPEVQADRVGIAREFAARWEAVVVLKGAGTVVAEPGGRAWINPSGGPNLATGGTGDVLSGIVGSLLAQGRAPADAALAGVYLHGLAGDLLARRHGSAGTLAGDLLAEIPVARVALQQEGETDQ